MDQNAIAEAAASALRRRPARRTDHDDRIVLGDELREVRRYRDRAVRHFEAAEVFFDACLSRNR